MGLTAGPGKEVRLVRRAALMGVLSVVAKPAQADSSPDSINLTLPPTLEAIKP